jgi:hypothetical protein
LRLAFDIPKLNVGTKQKPPLGIPGGGLLSYRQVPLTRRYPSCGAALLALLLADLGYLVHAFAFR